MWYSGTPCLASKLASGRPQARLQGAGGIAAACTAAGILCSSYMAPGILCSSYMDPSYDVHSAGWVATGDDHDGPGLINGKVMCPSSSTPLSCLSPEKGASSTPAVYHKRAIQCHRKVHSRWLRSWLTTPPSQPDLFAPRSAPPSSRSAALRGHCSRWPAPRKMRCAPFKTSHCLSVRLARKGRQQCMPSRQMQRGKQRGATTAAALNPAQLR